MKNRKKHRLTKIFAILLSGSLFLMPVSAAEVQQEAEPSTGTGAQIVSETESVPEEIGAAVLEEEGASEEETAAEEEGTADIEATETNPEAGGELEDPESLPTEAEVAEIQTEAILESETETDAGPEGEIRTDVADYSEDVLQAGGLLNAEEQSGIAVLSAAESERREYLWEQLEAGFLAFSEEIPLDTSYGVTEEDLHAVFNDILNYDYRFFYVSTTIKYDYYTESGIITRLKPAYTMTEAEAAEGLVLLEGELDRAAAGAEASWSDLEKALYLNDYLARNCEYDRNHGWYSAYGALVEKSATCQGYALAYLALADRLGLSCDLVTSDALDHAWNVVKVGSSYYHVDVTWDDPTPDMLGRAEHGDFLKSSSYFNSSGGEHAADDWVYGGGLSSADAADPSYDSCFWNDSNTGFEYVGGTWYGIVGSSLNAYACSGSAFTQTGTALTLTDVWYSWGTTSPLSSTYYKLASKEGLLYYSGPEAVYSYDPSDGGSCAVYNLSDEYASLGYIYGMRVTADGKFEISLATASASGSVGIYNIDTQGGQSSGTGDLSAATVTLGTKSYTYDGTAKKPAVTVTYGSSVLAEGTDYTVSYGSNTNAGTATVTVTGKGNYTGTASATFTIAKASQTLSASIASSTITAGKTTSVTAKGTGTITYKSSDTSVATVSGSGTVSGIEPGTVTITVNAAGNGNYNSASRTIAVTVKADTSLNGVCKSLDGSWYYYVKGIKQTGYTGFATNSNGKWYVEKGKVTKTTNGVFKDTTGAIGAKNEWYYVVGSKVQTGFTGLANYKNSSGWWYITKGVVDRSYSGLAKNNNGWFYLTKGKVDRSYTGFASNANGKWYVEKGKLTRKTNGVLKDGKGAIGAKDNWYYVIDSKVQTGFTGLANYKNASGWWYITKGVVDRSYTGIAKNNNGTWYVRNGKVQKSFNGTVTAGGKTYVIRGGKVV